MDPDKPYQDQTLPESKQFNINFRSNFLWFSYYNNSCTNNHKVEILNKHGQSQSMMTSANSHDWQSMLHKSSVFSQSFEDIAVRITNQIQEQEMHVNTKNF